MADLSAIEDYVTEVNQLIEEVSGRLARLKKAGSNLPATKRSDDINIMKNRLDRARKALKTMKVEIRELSKVEQKPHTEKATQLEERINQIAVDVEWVEKDEGGGQNGPELDHNQILDKAKAIQESDKSTLTGVLQTVHQTIEVGSATLVKMNEQSEQIMRVDKGVDEVSSNLKLASRHLRTFVRRLATDKIVMGFIFLIFAAIVFIIVWSIVKPNSNTNVPSSVKNAPSSVANT